MIVVLAGCAPDKLELASANNSPPSIRLMNVLLAAHALDIHYIAWFILREPGTINPV
jgi:hypothetical protein